MGESPDELRTLALHCKANHPAVQGMWRLRGMPACALCPQDCSPSRPSGASPSQGK